jgi:hypothetical protein
MCLFKDSIIKPTKYSKKGGGGREINGNIVERVNLFKYTVYMY